MSEDVIYTKEELDYPLKDNKNSEFEQEILDFMEEYDWIEVLIDEDCEFIMVSPNGERFCYREFVESEQINKWLDLNDRYNDGER
jgi:hypothetical protein